MRTAHRKAFFSLPPLSEKVKVFLHSELNEIQHPGTHVWFYWYSHDLLFCRDCTNTPPL